MTAVSWWAHKVDNGYFIWSFQGRILQRHQLDQFCSFIWRPRPPTLLKADDIAKIKKDLKKYSKQFELKDKSTQSKASKELIEKRRALFNEFASVRNRHKSQFEEMKEARMMLRGGIDTDSLDSGYDETDDDILQVRVEFLRVPDRHFLLILDNPRTDTKQFHSVQKELYWIGNKDFESIFGLGT